MIHQKHNPHLLPVALYTHDHKESPPYAAISKCLTRLIKRYPDANYNAEQIPAPTGDEHYHMIAPQGTDIGDECAAEFFGDREYIMGDEDDEPQREVQQWYWNTKAQQFWVLDDKGEFHCSDCWDKLIAEANPDDGTNQYGEHIAWDRFNQLKPGDRVIVHGYVEGTGPWGATVKNKPFEDTKCEYQDGDEEWLVEVKLDTYGDEGETFMVAFYNQKLCVLDGFYSNP